MQIATIIQRKLSSDDELCGCYVIDTDSDPDPNANAYVLNIGSLNYICDISEIFFKYIGTTNFRGNLLKIYELLIFSEELEDLIFNELHKYKQNKIILEVNGT